MHYSTKAKCCGRHVWHSTVREIWYNLLYIDLIWSGVLGISTDLAGNVCIPDLFSGVCGVKPSVGRIHTQEKFGMVDLAVRARHYLVSAWEGQCKRYRIV